MFHKVTGTQPVTLQISTFTEIFPEKLSKIFLTNLLEKTSD